VVGRPRAAGRSVFRRRPSRHLARMGSYNARLSDLSIPHRGRGGRGDEGRAAVPAGCCCERSIRWESSAPTEATAKINGHPCGAARPVLGFDTVRLRRDGNCVRATSRKRRSAIDRRTALSHRGAGSLRGLSTAWLKSRPRDDQILAGTGLLSRGCRDNDLRSRVMIPYTSSDTFELS